VGSERADSTWPTAERLQARLRESRALRRTAQQARARARAARDQARRGRSRRQVRRGAAPGRLPADLAAMPVIEQATGIIMARQRCGPPEAAALLGQAARRAGLTTAELAAQLIEQTAASGSAGNVTPICMGAIRHLRSHTQAPTG
jgi:hypothetical protein